MSNGKTTLGELTRYPQIKVSKSTLFSIVSSYKALKYKKRKPQPRMTKTHQQNHLNWAKDHMSWKLEYERVIFSNEKKIDLDAPDLFFNYWHNLLKDAETFSKRQQAGGSLTVWAAFGFHDKMNTGFPSGRMNT